MYLPSARRNMLYFTVRSMCARVRNGSYFCDVFDEDLEIVELDVVDDEVLDRLRPFGGDLGADIDDDEGARKVGERRRHRERDATAHRVSEHDRVVKPLIGDERNRVAHHGVDRVVLLTVPF